jgi:shikimate kinase
MGKLGDLVLKRADVVIWLDLPIRVWLPRLVRRTARRIVRREALWNGNREELRFVVDPRYSVIYYALRHHRARRHAYPTELARFPVVRLRTTRDVDEFLRRAERASAARRSRPQP